MNKIDLGFLNKKQLNRLLEGIRQSNINIIEIHTLKVKRNISVVLEFRTRKERDEFNITSGKLTNELRRLQ